MNTTTAENPGTALVVAGTLMTPAIFQDPEKIGDVLARLEREVRSIDRDISTPEGRSQIASVAYKIARSKTALDEMGKNLVADWKKSADLVDAERRKIRARCDALKDEFRAPLTEWEQAEERRVASHQAALDNLQRLADMTGLDTSAAVRERISELGRAFGRSWEEFAVRASTVAELATMRLDKRLEACAKAEAEAARLEAERVAREEQERREREERIAAEAAERAEEEARRRQELIDRQRDEEAQRERLERERLERERLEREEAQKIERELAQRAQALREARLQEEREAAEQRAREAEQQAADRAARAAAEAAAAERQRQADAQAAAAAEEERRANSRRIRGRVHTAIAQALVAKCDLTEDKAKLIVVAIATGQLPKVSIEY